MQARRLICSTGPTSQLRSISQFIACCPPEVGSIPLPWQPCNLYLGGLCRLPTGSTHYGFQAVFPGRHKGMGSLPSATITACSVRITGLPGALLLGIAQYSPHRAKAVSKNSTVLFIGGASESRSFSAWPGVYALARICGGPPVHNLRFPRFLSGYLPEGGASSAQRVGRGLTTSVRVDWNLGGVWIPPKSLRRMDAFDCASPIFLYAS